jgi:acyl-ACP thioesterase
MASRLQRTFQVASYELNMRQEARLTTMANYFQEVAYQHANELGLGYRHLKSRKHTWILSRMKICMKRYPVWDEHIEVETWPSGVAGLFALRDFRVRNRDGEVLGEATTCWLIVDLDSHRPIRPREELMRFTNLEFGEPVFGDALDKIGLPEGMQELHVHRVRYSDVDIVGHSNNVKYMEWCLDAAVKHGSLQGDRMHRQVAEFEINYMKETTMGDEVRIQEAPGTPGSSMLFNGVRASDGAEVFRARILLSEHQG